MSLREPDAAALRMMSPAWTQPPLKPLLQSKLAEAQQKMQPRPKSKKGKKQAAAQSPLASSSLAAHKHTDLPNGLLQANPAGRHPILDLVADAEREWDAMLARQSKSLDEAVAEYKRRYGRRPPRGFDRW
jgi:hypothetical protein